MSNNGKLDELPANSTIGTGSLRRAAQLLAYRRELRAQPIRGNVDTRLRKVSSGKVSGIIVAAAGMIRLGLADMITEYLSPEIFLPAVGQGALGIEIREGDNEMAALTSALNHEPAWRSVSAERAFLHAVDGGCHTPVAALGTMKGNTLTLQGMVATTDGSQILQASEEGDSQAPEQVGIRLAQKMLEMGASELITEVRVQ